MMCVLNKISTKFRAGFTPTTETEGGGAVPVATCYYGITFEKDPVVIRRKVRVMIATEQELERMSILQRKGHHRLLHYKQHGDDEGRIEIHVPIEVAEVRRGDVLQLEAESASPKDMPSLNLDREKSSPLTIRVKELLRRTSSFMLGTPTTDSTTSSVPNGKSKHPFWKLQVQEATKDDAAKTTVVVAKPCDNERSVNDVLDASTKDLYLRLPVYEKQNHVPRWETMKSMVALYHDCCRPELFDKPKYLDKVDIGLPPVVPAKHCLHCRAALNKE